MASTWPPAAPNPYAAPLPSAAPIPAPELATGLQELLDLIGQADASAWTAHRSGRSDLAQERYAWKGRLEQLVVVLRYMSEPPRGSLST
jgi:hypothetical protein